MVRKTHDAVTSRAFLTCIPMSRYGTPDYVAAAAIYLAVPRSTIVTGVMLPGDGGCAAGGVIGSTRAEPKAPDPSKRRHIGEQADAADNEDLAERDSGDAGELSASHDARLQGA